MPSFGSRELGADAGPYEIVVLIRDKTVGKGSIPSQQGDRVHFKSPENEFIRWHSSAFLDRRK